ncbi:FKBP-type peptidyl-prolyl cis-trans isomerase [Streptomyces sp. NRRL F-5123]|uniref:FKBP-type peptidyl-prolyl cis-trans isomerase n=1 Tax=Streptomyces sp. NRRL F-5123 TaxID=1463856 RepID=UPI0004E22980|nr:FKBP-type peptidyl-prolyl cis-trans isomerase [Streptomyces sp. NRRL F-5123]
MRRRSVLLAVPALMLTAAGCGKDSGKSGSGASTSPSATDSATPSATSTATVSGPLPAVTAGTAFNMKPTVAKGPGTPSKELAVKTLIQGSGVAVAAGDYVRVNYLGQIWKSAKVFDTSWGKDADGKAKQPYATQIGAQKVIPGWDQGLIGAKANSRVMLGVPPALGYGTSGNAQAGIAGTDTLVFVVDVLDVWNGRSSAKGKLVPQDDANLPKVGTNVDGLAPSVTVPKVKAPTKLVSNYVIEGDGATVKETDTLLVQYKGVLWDGGKEFDSSYSRKQLTDFPLSGVIPGWTKGLAGKKVGSRVVLVTPPDQAYGDQAQQTIPANSTLVFTVDIIAVI